MFSEIWHASLTDCGKVPIEQENERPITENGHDLLSHIL